MGFMLSRDSRLSQMKKERGRRKVINERIQIQTGEY
jgi:hypothetical protein